MKPMLRHGVAVTAAALVLGTGLAACGSSSDTTGSRSPVWPGVGGTVAAAPAAGGGSTTSSEVAPGSTVDSATFTQKLRAATEATTSAHVAMSMDLGGQQVSGQGDVAMKPLAEDVTISAMGMSMEVRLVDDTFYVKVPAAAGLGDKWIKATTEELSSASGMSGLTSLTDPMAMFNNLGDSIRHVTYVGSDAVGQHYQMTVDTRQMMRSMGVSGAQMSQMHGSMPSTVTEDVWFDAAGHVVKAKADMGSAGATTVTMSDFGKPVRVTAPRADQTEDLSGLSGLGGVGSL